MILLLYYLIGTLFIWFWEYWESIELDLVSYVLYVFIWPFVFIRFFFTFLYEMILFIFENNQKKDKP